MFDDDEVATLARTWAEAVLRQVATVRTLRERATLQGRQFDWAEDWSPTEEDLYATWREQWSAEHTLVWSAYQMQRMTIRLAKDLRRDGDRARIAEQLDPSSDAVLTALRNALEHLDEAAFADSRAVADGTPPGRNRALRSLPGQELGLWLGGHELFALVDPDALSRRARAVLKALDAESDAHAEYLVQQYLIDTDDDLWPGRGEVGTP